MRAGLTASAGGHPVEIWAEAYRPTTGTTVMTYDDGPLAGEAAVVRNGNAISIGAWSKSLVTEVLRDALIEAGISVVELPEGIRVCHRGGLQIWMNFNEVETHLPDGSAMAPVSYQLRT